MMETKHTYTRFSDWLTRAVSTSPSSFALFVGLFITVIIYRMQLTIGLFTNRVKPFDFHPAGHPLWFALAYLPYDLAVVLSCSLMCWLLSQGTHFVRESKGYPALKITGMILLQMVLLGLVLIHGVHGRLLFDVQTGVDHAVIKEAFSGIPAIETIKLTNLRDYLFLLFPFGIFWLFILASTSLRVWVLRVFLVLAVCLFSLSLFAVNGRAKDIPSEISLNPALFLISDLTDDFLKSSTRNQKSDRVDGIRPELRSPRLREADPVERANSLPAKSKHPWNVVFFVMESVGTRYIFETGHGHPMPMPFLRKISEEGWYLKKHFTTSNVSTKAVFSLFSGLYDFFNRETFGTRTDAELPSVYNWVGEGYDRFLVTPSSISWYFPTNFLKNNGPGEIDSYENLRFNIKEEFHSLGHYIARDEVQTVDFFIQRLSTAREPFFATYISFAAHFPYFDYGEDDRVFPDDGRLISRYYNNLSLLDRMIKRIVEHLKAKGLLERTILVIVGDHGQAFGQHQPNNFMHYRYSYNENLETPAIFYQPALFKPRVYMAPSSHVDILPTLLDAMRIPYASTAFDGESLFHRRSKRTIYFYGYEESISSLDNDWIKTQYSLKKKSCWAYDLKQDPEEKNPVDCSLYPAQREALHRYVSEHDADLLRYNTKLKEKMGCPAGRETISSR